MPSKCRSESADGVTSIRSSRAKTGFQIRAHTRHKYGWRNPCLIRWCCFFVPESRRLQSRQYEELIMFRTLVPHCHWVLLYCAWGMAGLRSKIQFLRTYLYSVKICSMYHWCWKLKSGVVHWVPEQGSTLGIRAAEHKGCNWGMQVHWWLQPCAVFGNTFSGIGWHMPHK